MEASELQSLALSDWSLHRAITCRSQPATRWLPYEAYRPPYEPYDRHNTYGNSSLPETSVLEASYCLSCICCA